MGGALLTGVHARPNVWVVGQIDENSLKVLYQHPFGHSICEAEYGRLVAMLIRLVQVDYYNKLYKIAEKLLKSCLKSSCNLLKFSTESAPILCGSDIKVTIMIETEARTLRDYLADRVNNKKNVPVPDGKNKQMKKNHNKNSYHKERTNWAGNDTKNVKNKRSNPMCSQYQPQSDALPAYFTATDVLRMYKFLSEATEEQCNIGLDWPIFCLTNIEVKASFSTPRFTNFASFCTLMSSMTFFEPEEQDRYKNVKDESSTVFSIGMTLLSIYILYDCSDCYDYKNMSFLSSVFESKLDRMHYILYERLQNNINLNNNYIEFEEELVIAISYMTSERNSRLTLAQLKAKYQLLLKLLAEQRVLTLRPTNTPNKKASITAISQQLDNSFVQIHNHYSTIYNSIQLNSHDNDYLTDLIKQISLEKQHRSKVAQIKYTHKYGFLKRKQPKAVGQTHNQLR